LEKVRQEIIVISGVLFPAALPLFHSFTQRFPAKASLGMGKSTPSWRTFCQFLGILAYKSGWLMWKDLK
jgi:hypothetical protein